MIRDPFRFYRVAPPAPTYGPVELPMVDVQSSLPSDFVANRVRQGGAAFMRPVVGLMGQPQLDMVEMFTGVEQTPSEAMGISNPVVAFLTDAGLDPLNIGVTSIGGAMMRNSMRNPFGAFNLRNAYRYNPWALTAKKIAEKNPDDYFRVVKNPSAIDDAIETGIIRANTSLDPNFSSGKGVFKPNQVYFTKGVPEVGERYGRNIIQVPSNTPMKSQWLNQDFSKKLRKEGLFTNEYHLPGEYVVPNLGEDFIRASDATFYKPHWLQGYKQIK